MERSGCLSVELELAGAVSWNLPHASDLVALPLSLVEDSVGSPVLLGEGNDVALSLASDVEAANVIGSGSGDTEVGHIHIQVHLLLLAVLPESTGPSWGAGLNLESALAVSWNLPLASKVDALHGT